MVTQEFISDLWTLVPKFKNIAIRSSYAPDSLPRSGMKNWSTPSNSEISINGGRANGYRAPLQIVTVLPPAHPPTNRERNTMNPVEQKNLNLAMEKIAVPDPRMNITCLLYTSPSPRD